MIGATGKSCQIYRKEEERAITKPEKIPLIGNNLRCVEVKDEAERALCHVHDDPDSFRHMILVILVCMLLIIH